MTVAIRPLVEADLPALARGLAALPLMERYGRTAPKLEAALRAALARGEGLLVAEGDGGAVAGLAWFLTTGTLAMGGYLKLIAVLDRRPGGEGSRTAPPGGEGAPEPPRNKGKGAGAALLAAFEAEVAKASAHAFLLVSDFNAGAQAFYERHGYVRAGSLPGLVLPDVAETLYWKRLR